MVQTLLPCRHHSEQDAQGGRDLSQTAVAFLTVLLGLLEDTCSVCTMHRFLVITKIETNQG